LASSRPSALAALTGAALSGCGELLIAGGEDGLLSSGKFVGRRDAADGSVQTAAPPHRPAA